MSTSSVFRTRLTETLGIRHPIIQGGLAYLATAELAAAVSNGGGLGQITATTLPSLEALREEIERAQRLTDKPFGVNFAIADRKGYLHEWVKVALDMGVPAISLTAGNPEPFVRLARELRGDDVKILVLTAGVRQAQKVEQMGADVVVAVGQEGGGHVGREEISTMVLVPCVVDAVSIPVVASGGLADGRGLAAALAMGADGIEMGTRFVATVECPAHPAYKEALVALSEEDTVMIKRSIGRPARALKGPFVERILVEEAAGSDLQALLPLISGRNNVRSALEGSLDEGFVWAGQAIGLIHDLPTAAELIDHVVRDARLALRRSNGLLVD